MFHACRSIDEGSLCQHDIQDHQQPQLKNSSTCIERVRFSSYFNPQLTLYTRYIAISNHGMPASTSLPVVFGSTVSTKSTVARIAKGLAFSPCKTTARNKVTFFSGGTISVAAASCLNASQKRIALETRGTDANGSVEIYFTVGPSATCCGQARINTFLGLASFVTRTISINLALN